MTGHRKSHESDDLERYLDWRVEQWELDRRRLLKGAAGAALAGMAASFIGAGSAFARRFGSEANPAQGQTLDVFRANHVPFYEWAGKRFEQQNNAKLNWTREQFGLIPSKLTPAFQSGGHTWDVAYMWRAWVEQYREFLTPLDQIGYTLPASKKRDMLPVSYKQIVSAHDGKVYGLPSNTYTYVLYGNKKRLARIGVKRLPQNYQDFVALCKELTSKNKQALGYTDGWAPLYLFPKWCVWLHLNGGQLFAGDHGAVHFDSPQAMQATQDMINLLPYMPKESITSPWGIYDVEAKKVFFSGQAAMLIDYQHIWYEGQDPKQSKIGAGNVLVDLVPGSKKLSGGKVGPRSGGQFVGECFVIPKTSTKKEAALELLKFLSNPVTQIGLLTQRAAVEKFDPAGEDGFPAYKSDYVSRSVRGPSKRIVDITLAQQRYPGKRYETRPTYQAISDAVEAAVSAALNKQKDVEAAHKQGQKAIAAIVAKEQI
jgi:ABC-type glycerol-3-phosphate transport system substrate-binding protein